MAAEIADQIEQRVVAGRETPYPACALELVVVPPGGDYLQRQCRSCLQHSVIGTARRTPGLVVAATDLLRQNPQPTDDEIREALSGNLCRCTGYAKIFDAVRLAAERT